MFADSYFISRGSLLNFGKKYIFSKSLTRSYQCKVGVYGYKPHLANKDSYTICKDIIDARNNNGKLHRLISAFREYGHLNAEINPLNNIHTSLEELNPLFYGLKPDETHSLQGLLYDTSSSMTVNEIETLLKKLFCGHISAEFMHLPTMEEREWFAETFESLNSSEGILSNEEKVSLAINLLKSQVFDHFLGAKFPSFKRYAGEGAESMMGFFFETFKQLSQDNVEDVIISKAHRGRLNLQTVLLDLAPIVMFRKIMGFAEFNSFQTTGDVLSHFVSSQNLDLDGKKINITLLPNPSHLEAVNPVLCGYTRSRQKFLEDGHYSTDVTSRPADKVVGMQVHGDAAISGQGIVQETMAFSNVAHFSTGGTIHLCVNNQIGYTNPGEKTRSSVYSTDIAKFASYPIIHVNGNKPEEAVKAARLAVAYQRKFRRDIFIDMVCFRRWGHNELDNPRFTNPEMYSIIDSLQTVPDIYAESLIQEGLMSETDVKSMKDEYYNTLNKDFKLSKEKVEDAPHLQYSWKNILPAPTDKTEVWDTGVEPNQLKYLGAKSVEIPEEFKIHPNLMTSHVTPRLERLTSGTRINWPTAEALAMASILDQGFGIRLSGQDVGRGTFSQRHCMLVNQDTNDIYIPLNNMKEGQTAYLEVANSILSEEAVLGFEYGMSIEDPNTLFIWEAQFGDFFNGAQIIIDTMVSSGETKWATKSGLVLLLPHGYDGAGPEHSSSRFERFLQNCNSREDRPDSEDVNWNVVFPTTSAQYFHLLRRQMIRNYRKPLIIVGPKTLLRLNSAESNLEEMSTGTHFLPVIGDDEIAPENVKKVIFVTGKHYYTLAAERKAREKNDVAIIRLEMLCPFPTQVINEQLAKYKKAKEFVWAQEEHRNMGGWSFVSPRFRNLCGTQLQYAGRGVAATPAVGIGILHQEECESIIEQALES